MDYRISIHLAIICGLKHGQASAACGLAQITPTAAWQARPLTLISLLRPPRLPRLLNLLRPPRLPRLLNLLRPPRLERPLKILLPPRLERPFNILGPESDLGILASLLPRAAKPASTAAIANGCAAAGTLPEFWMHETAIYLTAALPSATERVWA